jgi:hypothetical protein
MASGWRIPRIKTAREARAPAQYQKNQTIRRKPKQRTAGHAGTRRKRGTAYKALSKST